MKPLVCLSLGLFVLLFAGCASPSRAKQGIAVDASPAEILAAAEAMLEREFGPVTVDRGRMMIQSTPREYSVSADSGTVRDLYGGSSRLRRTAFFQLDARGPTPIAKLRIDVERNDTDRYALVATQREREISETVSHTPIEFDAATSAEQNEIWTALRRDRLLERKLLDQLRRQVAPEDVPDPAPAVDSATP